jgi:hypothetical protein
MLKSAGPDAVEDAAAGAHAERARRPTLGGAGGDVRRCRAGRMDGANERSSRPVALAEERCPAFPMAKFMAVGNVVP